MDTERIQPRHAGHFFAKCYAISEKMPRRCPEDEISKENCPEFQPASYPGKFSRNNKGGSKLSRDDKVEDGDNVVDGVDVDALHRVRYLNL